MKNTWWEDMASRLTSLVSRWPLAIIGTAGMLTVACLYYTHGHLEFWTERNVLLSQKSPSAIRYREYRQEVPDDYLIIVLESRDLEASKRFASLLGQRLKEDPEPVRQVFCRIPPESFARQALLFLSPEEIRDLRIKLVRHRDLLYKLTSNPDLVTLLKTVNQQVNVALFKHLLFGFLGGKGSEGEREGANPEALRFISSLMDSLYAWITEPLHYRSPWGVFLEAAGGVSEDGYLVDPEHGRVLVLAYLEDVEASFNREGAAIDRVREHIRIVSKEVPGVRAGITGTPALNSEEMASSSEDMSRALWLALLLVTAVFVLGFREARRPLMAVLVLSMGIVWTMGWLTLTVGHLTIITMAFGSILVGLGIDFGIHMIAHYEEQQRTTQVPREALEKTLQLVGRAILSAGLTTAAAFLALGLSRFRGIREFGWIAGWGILLCLLATLIVLPALLMLSDRLQLGTKKAKEHGGKRGFLMERMLGVPARRPALVLPLSACLTVLAILACGKTRFDYNLLHLQPKGTEAVEWETKLLEARGNASIFAVDMVDSLEEARRRAEAYEALPLVSKVESLASYLPENPAERMGEIQRLKPLLEDFVLNERAGRAPSASSVMRGINRIRFKLIEAGGEQGKDVKRSSSLPLSSTPPPDTISGARFRASRVLRAMKEISDPTTAPSLVLYQKRLFSDLRNKFRVLQASTDPIPITLEGLPELLKKRFLGSSGKWILQVYPREDIWQPEQQRPFVEQLRSVSPDVTGPAVANYESTKSLLDAYLKGGLFALCAILLILFLDFRHPYPVLLALAPLILGGLWTLLGMQLFGIRFNPANLVIIPLLVGMGVDDGIHVVRYFLNSPTPHEEIAGTSVGRAVTLTTLTTMAGFGSLMTARHQGIHSVGALLTLAMASCLIASVVVLPALIRMLPTKVRQKLWSQGQAGRARNGKAPEIKGHH